MAGPEFFATVVLAPIAGVASCLVLFALAVRSTSRTEIPDQRKAE